MSEPTELQTVDEQTAPTPAGLNQIERTEQTYQSKAGVQQSERVVTDNSGVAHSERSTRDVSAEHNSIFLMMSQLVWVAVGIIDGLIGMRVLLKLIGANANNDFGAFVYNFAGIFLAPFFGLTGSPSAGNMELEVPSIIAMIVYALLGWGIARVILLFNRPTTRSNSTYDRSNS